MTDRPHLPAGITPRLLRRGEVAAYLAIHPETFERHVRPHLPEVEIGTRTLWDIKVLDRWLDEKSGLVGETGPVEDWIGRLDHAQNGDDRARR
jgi:hypothetical protein